MQHGTLASPRINSEEIDLTSLGDENKATTAISLNKMIAESEEIYFRARNVLYDEWMKIITGGISSIAQVTTARRKRHE